MQNLRSTMADSQLNIENNKSPIDNEIRSIFRSNPIIDLPIPVDNSKDINIGTFIFVSDL